MKIPARGLSLLCELLKQGICLWSLHRGFGHHWKFHSKRVCAELGNLSVIAWLLVSEIIRRKSNHHQASVFETGIELFQAVVLLGETAIARSINDQHDLTAVLAEVLSDIVLKPGKAVVKQGGAGLLFGPDLRGEGESD